jgi:outer membrane protein assembly factor BamB
MNHSMRYWSLITTAVIIIAFLCSTIACEPQDSGSTPPLEEHDTQVPSPVSGLTAVDAYRGNVNLRWSEAIDGDFDRYELYISKSKIEDIQGLQPIHVITDISHTTFQVSGLEEGTTYYFSVLAVNKQGTKNTEFPTVNVTTSIIPVGKVDSDFHIDIFKPELICAGTTLFPDNHIHGAPRIVEVNLLGEIIWEYTITKGQGRYTNPGLDAELLPGDTILYLLPRYGIFEIDRDGNTIWSYPDKKVSHDADRLANGNTLFVFGANDGINDTQVKEVNPEGQIVWSWQAKDYFNKPPYKDIYGDGWLHTNAVTRLPNGNTLLSPRNFDFVIELGPDGSVIRTIGEGIFSKQHDPEVQPNGNILAASHNLPQRVIELDSETGDIVWQFTLPDRSMWPIRDADRLPNGNTLITGTTRILEVTGDGEIVWQLTLSGVSFDDTTIEGRRKAAECGFYKAQRVCTDNNY